MIIFVVVGRFGKSLTVSKVEPFLATGKVSKVYIFRQEAGFPVEGAEYITLPELLLNLKPAWLSKAIRFLYEPLQLLRYTIMLKPNLINGVFTLPKGLNSTVVGKITKTHSVVSVVGGIVEITTRLPFIDFWEKLNLWMLKSCSAVTTKGHVVTNYLIYKGIPKDKIFTLNGSIDTTKFAYKPDIAKDIDILFVGNFSRLKGPDRVLKVISNLSKEIPDIKAVLIGHGDLFKSMKQMIIELNLQNQVELPGYIDHPETLFQRSKCILIPSESEGLPTCMLEGMSCGCVPVVSEVGNIIEAALHETNAMVVKDYTDINSFICNAKKLLTNDALRNQMAQNAIHTVQEKYSIKKQAKIVNDIIEFLSIKN